MALFFERMLKCVQKVLDTADIVRDAMLRQLCSQALTANKSHRSQATFFAASAACRLTSGGVHVPSTTSRRGE